MSEQLRPQRQELQDDEYRENHGEMLEVAFDRNLKRNGDRHLQRDDVERLAEKAMQHWDVLDRMQGLTNAFDKRKDSILSHIRSVKTRNLASISADEIKEAMEKYEEELGAQKGARSNLAGFFGNDRPEVVLEGGLYHMVRDKEHFFHLLASEIHKELFEKTEFFKNVSGVFATRLDKDGKTEVLLVRSKKTGIWQFPGGKAEYVCPNPDTGKVGIVTKRGDTWQFADGKKAPNDGVVLEKPEECLRREISEELGEDVGQATLSTSGFYSIGNSRFLIHGFIANNLNVDLDKVKQDEIDKIDWTSDPFKAGDGSPRPMTDQTRDVLERFFQRSNNSNE